MAKSVESYAHKSAKQVVVGWLRETAGVAEGIGYTSRRCAWYSMESEPRCPSLRSMGECPRFKKTALASIRCGTKYHLMALPTSVMAIARFGHPMH